MNCKKYFVPDLLFGISNLTIIFVLESPYSDEVIHKHPVAGSSGMNMSLFLHQLCEKIDPDKPLGCQIFSRKVDKIGIINCSRFPLDKNTYECQTITNLPIGDFDYIRRNYRSIILTSQNAQKTRQYLLNKLKNKTKYILSQNDSIIFIPCGDLARNFMRRCDIPEVNVYLKTVPHPSRNQWSKATNFEDFEEFIELIGMKLN